MENKCKIVQDLLPTYLENMTSPDTTFFIDEHLKTCAECKNILKLMQDDIEKENLENTETLKNIKNYKRKILTAKTIILLIILIFAIIIINYVGNITYKFWIVNNAFEKNTNYYAYGNFTLREYDDSIEHYENHYTIYSKGNELKKTYGNDILEYYDGKNHYYFDNENNTYWIVENTNTNTTLNIDMSFMDGMENILTENGINKLEILKFVIFQEDVYIKEEGFRNKDYYIIKNNNNQKIYIDKDTFFVERTEKANSLDAKKDYRITTADVCYRDLQMPDLSQYTLIQK